jgi:hypothetical protein
MSQQCEAAASRAHQVDIDPNIAAKRAIVTPPNGPDGKTFCVMNHESLLFKSMRDV